MIMEASISAETFIGFNMYENISLQVSWKRDELFSTTQRNIGDEFWYPSVNALESNKLKIL